MTDRKANEIDEIIKSLDPTEQAMLLLTLNAFSNMKSKGGKTRRLNEFKRWIEGYRAKAVAA